jgi:hypothetical protein
MAKVCLDIFQSVWYGLIYKSGRESWGPERREYRDETWPAIFAGWGDLIHQRSYIKSCRRWQSLKLKIAVQKRTLIRNFTRPWWSPSPSRPWSPSFILHYQLSARILECKATYFQTWRLYTGSFEKNPDVETVWCQRNAGEFESVLACLYQVVRDWSGTICCR